MRSVRHWRHSIHLLLTLLRPPPAEPPLAGVSAAAWHDLLRLAGACWLSGALDWRFRLHGLTASLPSEVRDYAEAAADAFAYRAGDQCEQVHAIARLLNQHGIRPILLKGSAAHLTGLYPAPGARFCSDIDLLVAPDEAERAADLLRRQGYAERPDEAGIDHPGLKHVPRLLHPDQPFGVEIHRSLSDGRLSRVLSAEAALAGAAPLISAAADLAILRHDHRIIHCIMHMMTHYAEGRPVPLRQLLELRLLAEQRPSDLDWPGIADEFRRGGGTLEFQYCLLLAARLVGLKKPALAYHRRARLWAWSGHHVFVTLPGLGLPWALFRLIRHRLKLQGISVPIKRLAQGKNLIPEGVALIRRIIAAARQLA